MSVGASLGWVYMGRKKVLETYVIDADDGQAALLVQAGSLTLNPNLYTFVHSPSIPRDSVIFCNSLYESTFKS